MSTECAKATRSEARQQSQSQSFAAAAAALLLLLLLLRRCSAAARLASYACVRVSVSFSVGQCARKSPATATAPALAHNRQMAMSPTTAEPQLGERAATAAALAESERKRARVCV